MLFPRTDSAIIIIFVSFLCLGDAEEKTKKCGGLTTVLKIEKKLKEKRRERETKTEQRKTKDKPDGLCLFSVLDATNK